MKPTDMQYTRSILLKNLVIVCKEAKTENHIFTRIGLMPKPFKHPHHARPGTVISRQLQYASRIHIPREKGYLALIQVKEN